MSVPPTQSVHHATSILDSFPGIGQTTADLRDEHGRLDARRVCEAFGFSNLTELACVAEGKKGVIRDRRSTPTLIPVLETLEKIARIRAIKQVREPDTFRSWWHRKIPSLGDRSPYDTWLEGKGQKVVDLVDRVLVGDTRG